MELNIIDWFKKKRNSNIRLKNIHPVGAALFHADCWTDRETGM